MRKVGRSRQPGLQFFVSRKVWAANNFYATECLVFPPLPVYRQKEIPIVEMCAQIHSSFGITRCGALEFTISKNKISGKLALTRKT